MALETNPLADQLFSAMTIQQSGLERLSNNALSNGINKYSNKDYRGAIKAFKQAINFSPYSDYAPDAAKYMANAYQKLGDSKGAIKAYEDAIRLNSSRDDLYTGLGNLYYAENRFGDARNAYAKAVNIDRSETNLFSLGQADLSLERYSEAESLFQEVARRFPGSHSGHYGLGQAYSQQGLYTKAIQSFETALEKNRTFYDAYAEMGYAYADMGDVESAEAIQSKLAKLDETLADTLSGYINKVAPPQFTFVHSESTFNYRLSMNSPLYFLDADLNSAGSSERFSMKFQFSKEMDRASVQNIANWSISRSDQGRIGDLYNFGLPISDAEAALSPLPDFVLYDPEESTATVYFTIRQNADADATIDPSHIRFQFKGTDVYGTQMDKDADAFIGFSGIV